MKLSKRFSGVSIFAFKCTEEIKLLNEETVGAFNRKYSASNLNKKKPDLMGVRL